MILMTVIPANFFKSVSIMIDCFKFNGVLCPSTVTRDAWLQFQGYDIICIIFFASPSHVVITMY